MSKYDLDNIGHIDEENEEFPSTRRTTVQPEQSPAPRIVSARPMPVLGTPYAQKDIKLPDPVLPKQEAVPKVEAVALEKFPDDLKACFDLLAHANALPEDTDARKRFKELKLDAIRAHLHIIQQGVPVPARALATPEKHLVPSGLVASIRSKLLKKFGR